MLVPPGLPEDVLISQNVGPKILQQDKQVLNFIRLRTRCGQAHRGEVFGDAVADVVGQRDI
jgi:hypothetical protein